jgi:hypothetical protein
LHIFYTIERFSDDNWNWRHLKLSCLSFPLVRGAMMMTIMMTKMHMHCTIKKYKLFSSHRAEQINCNENESDAIKYKNNVMYLRWKHQAARHGSSRAHTLYETRCNLCAKCAEQDKIYITQRRITNIWPREMRARDDHRV